MKWLDSSREKWRQSKAKEQAINEAIEKQLTPELKLAILRSKQDSIIRWYWKTKLVLICAVFAVLMLVLVLAFCTMSSGLKQYFGENVWENIIESGSAQLGELPNLISIATIAIAAIACAITIYFIAKFSHDARKETRLKKEVLERLQETK